MVGGAAAAVLVGIALLVWMLVPGYDRHQSTSDATGPRFGQDQGTSTVGRSPTPPDAAYFAERLPRATRDSAFALAYVRRHATTPEAQRAVQEALLFKCDVLWAMLDALHAAYVAPGLVPPGVFVPVDHPGAAA